ncbi:MAG: UbiA family prenyltransferase [Bacteroidales bacterium]|nr:UbiA family prenyltransferase [Bacteroidales bacterium]
MKPENQFNINFEYSKLNLFQKLSILSIDVVIGAILSGAFVVKLLNINPGFAWWTILPISVWIIYTIDHLIDGYKLKNKAHTMRHYFHYRFAKQFTIVIACLTFVNLLLIVFFLERQIIVFGLIMSFATGIYFAGVYFSGNKRSLILQKEIFVALVYTVGIWGGPAALMDYYFSIQQLFFLCVFFLIAFSDLLVFSIYEEENDRNDQHNTFVINFGRKITIRFINIFAAIVFIVYVYHIEISSDLITIFAASILAAMMCVIIVLLYFQNFFKNRLLYRYIGELIFWLPGLILVVV